MENEKTMKIEMYVITSKKDNELYYIIRTNNTAIKVKDIDSLVIFRCLYFEKKDAMRTISSIKTNSKDKELSAMNLEIHPLIFTN